MENPKFTMKDTTEKAINRLAEHLFAVPVEEYLVSEEFSRFCKDHHIADIWAGQLELSKETRPELYGRDVVKNAFVLFLRHILHSRPGDFPEVFTLFLTDFLKGRSLVFPLGELKKDVLCLGYPAEDIENRFLNLSKIAHPQNHCSDERWKGGNEGTE